MTPEQKLELVQIPQHITGFCLPFIERLLSFIKESNEYREALTKEEDWIKVRTPGFDEAITILAKHLGLHVGDSSYVENLIKFVEGVEIICSLFKTETGTSRPLNEKNY